MDDSRTYDVVVLGATGYTARIADAHLARHRPDDLRWALSGRSRSRLEAARDDLVAIDPALADLPIEVVELTDATGLAALARSTRVLVNATGPYLLHGEPVVRACAEAGTDYVDLTGEPEFMDRMYLEHHATAVSTGSRLVHAAGFDSVPHDLGARHAINQVEVTGPVTLRGVVQADGGLSGGTLATMLNMMSRLGPMRRAASQRAEADPTPAGRTARQRTRRPRHDDVTGLWLLPLPTIDPAVIAHSAAALASYGPDFSYSHYAGLERLPVLAGALVGLPIGIALAQIRPVRRLISSRLPQGEGPDDAKRAGSRGFTVDFVLEHAGRTSRTRVTGPDPYDLSGIALAETALSLAFDDNPATAGQVTTAVAVGTSLTRRLEQHGTTFTVLD